MNKTININLGGFFFHIDEVAFQKLQRYLEAIAYSLSDDPQGKDEIIADIEARISELLLEKITDSRQVVNEGDIEEIIAIMGQPEDYTDAEAVYNEDTAYQHHKKTTTKKLFRDGNDAFLGGVCSGLGHYIGIDAIWIRLAFIVLTASGFSFLLYIILWILLPEAKTTIEKLQMEGEAVNIDNIEKKIRKEFQNISSKLKDGAHELSDKISSTNYEKLTSKTKSGFQDFMDTLGKILVAVFKIFGKFMGVLLLFISGVTLVSLLLGIFSIGSLEILQINTNFMQYPTFFYESVIPKGVLAILLFLLIGIPFIVLFILGLRILSPNIKKLNTTTILTLLGIWLVALLGIGFSAIEYATSTAYNGIHIHQQPIAYNTNEPLRIRVVNNDTIYYQHSLRNRDNAVNVFIDDTEMKYSNNVTIDVNKSETDHAYIEIKKTSEGKKRNVANKNAEDIIYNFTSTNNVIILDAYFLNTLNNMWKEEGIKVTIYIPEETTIYFEKSSKNFLYDIDNTNNMYDRTMASHHFKMTSRGLHCIDCETDNNLNDEHEEDLFDTDDITY